MPPGMGKATPGLLHSSRWNNFEGHGLSLLFFLLHLQLKFLPLSPLQSLLFLFDFAVLALLAAKTDLGLHEFNFDVVWKEKSMFPHLSFESL